MEQLIVHNAVRYRIAASSRPHVGVSVIITVATPQGERDLPAFWLPSDAAQALARALNKEALRARSAN